MAEYWAALLATHNPRNASPTDLQGIAVWALQFTPRVAHLDESVVMELEASERLFGGEDGLRQRVTEESRQLGIGAIGWASTSLAALALARCGATDSFDRPLAQRLDALALESLTALRPHRPTLARLGCQTLGDVRGLPRGGVSRRFGQPVLAALDQAYGLRPSAHDWVSLPETFHSTLELPGRIDSAASMMFGAHCLLLQMCGWLAAQNSGVTAFVLNWRHDLLRAKTAGEGGQLTVRCAEATRDVRHLSRLLAEHLAKVELLAPVGDIGLCAEEIVLLEAASRSFLPDTLRAGENLGLVLERIAARLGPERVRRPTLLEDHRIEWMQSWQPASGAKVGRAPSLAPSSAPRMVDIPQPSWVLPRPLRLAVARHRPLYQGPLQLVVGPHRVESGWWHRAVNDQGQQVTLNVQRDYWVALSEHAGALWIYQERLAHDDISWYLHGIFA